MKKLIIKLLYFFFLTLAAVIVYFFSVYQASSYRTSFKLNQDTKYVIFGHSHAECDYNDSLINKFQNLAESGESYLYSYIKLKNVLIYNGQLDTVFIEFTNNNIGAAKDKELWSDKYINWRYPKYAPFFGLAEHFLLLTKNFRSFKESFPISIERNTELAMSSNLKKFSGLGGYVYLQRDKTDSLMAIKKPPKIKNEIEKDISKYNIDYLEKMILECRKFDVTPILIRSPLHPYHPSVKNELTFQHLLNTRFSDIYFIDYKDMQFKTAEFGDFNHLNFRGAEKFSKYINRSLENNMLFNSSQL